jgi:hypothetical protein
MDYNLEVLLNSKGSLIDNLHSLYIKGSSYLGKISHPHIRIIILLLVTLITIYEFEIEFLI